jgi:hypothetical protein
MTLREAIVRRKRVAAIVTYAALGWFVAAMALSGGEPPWLFVAFPGFAVFLAGTFYLFFFLRCPRCRGAIGYTVSHLSGPFSVSRRIRFCPFCGVALDSELET